MKGDFSRFTFKPQNRYSRVLMQQGRVQLDADWNEQLDISAYRTAAEMEDFIGKNGAPVNPLEKAEPAFDGDINVESTSFRISVSDKMIFIGAGRYYVEGMLFENHQPVSFVEQPDYPDSQLLTANGFYLGYLDVWQYHVTALEAEDIRETALGGADTTTRLKNIWQVKLQSLGTSPDVNHLHTKFRDPGWKPDWVDAINQGTLKAKAEGANAIVENQLYRVEIHDVAAGHVRFKWSRDNGSIAARIEFIIGNKITLQRNGRDPHIDFAIGQLVEISDQVLALKETPGFLATIETIQAQTLTVRWHLLEGQDQPTGLNPFPTVRRWDCQEVLSINQPNNKDVWFQLEQGIEVQFDTTKTYKPGDYWLIPARALKGGIEWSQKAEGEPPHSLRHRYVSLALVERTANGFRILADYRQIFKPIVSGLVSKAGDTITGSLSINADLYANGKVGIGTGTPDARLTIRTPNDYGGDTLRVETKVESNLYNLKLKTVVTNGVVRWVFDQTNNSVSYESALAFDRGKIGLGTNNPEAKLEIGGALRATKDNDTLTALRIKPTFDDSDANLAGAIFSNVNHYGLIVESGNVGIGTPNPKSMLSVAGGVAIGSNYANQSVAPDNSLLVQNTISLGQLGNWRIQQGIKFRLRTRTGYEQTSGLRGNFLILDDPGNLYICPINTSFLTNNQTLNVLLRRPSRWTFSVLPTWTYQTNPTPGLTPEQIKVTDWREGQDLPSEMQDNENGADYVEGYRFWQVRADVKLPSGVIPPGVIILIFTRIM